MIRPHPADWFELWVARDDLVAALDALARTGAMELETDSAAVSAQQRTRADEAAREIARFVERYGIHLTLPLPAAPVDPAAPLALLEDALARLRAWARQADPLLAALQALDARSLALADMQRMVQALGDTTPDLGAFARASPPLASIALVLPADAALPVLPDGAIARRSVAPEETFLLALGAGPVIEELRRIAGTEQVRTVDLPPWLGADHSANLALVAQARAQCKSERDARCAELAALNAHATPGRALADALRASWCCGRTPGAAQASVLARVTGWTNRRRDLCLAIAQSAARALIRFPPAPEGLRPPLVLRNPRWARPFEIFPRLLGMPARTGADPTTLLAFVVPLLFGYMFGDLGQGLLLAAAGLLLRRRWPIARLLIPCGLSAAAFGVVFGSVFTMEGAIEPLWAHSIDAPLEVLLVPLAGGVVLLSIGLGIAALEAWWAHAGVHWLAHEAPLIATYWGVLAAILVPRIWPLATAGAIWTALAALIVGQGATGALAALGDLLKGIFQLLVNTLSFVRVGAFALAHAGMSAAVAAFAESAETVAARVLILLLGNIVTLAIEVLVVSVQTTRLVLFEFFARFFVPQGREFRPVDPILPGQEMSHDTRL